MPIHVGPVIGCFKVMWLVCNCCYSILIYLVLVVTLFFLLPNPVLSPICPVDLVSAFSVAVSPDTAVVITVVVLTSVLEHLLLL